jgi:hypothetical protein
MSPVLCRFRARAGPAPPQAAQVRAGSGFRSVQAAQSQPAPAWGRAAPQQAHATAARAFVSVHAEQDQGSSPLRGGASSRRGGASSRRGGASSRRGGASSRRGGASPLRGGASSRRGGASSRRGGAAGRLCAPKKLVIALRPEATAAKSPSESWRRLQGRPPPSKPLSRSAAAAAREGPLTLAGARVVFVRIAASSS